MSLSFSNLKREAYNTLQLSKFIGYINQLGSLRRVDVVFYDHTIKLKLYPQTFPESDSTRELEVLYRHSARLSSLARLGSARPCFSSVCNLERLDIRRGKFDTSGLPYAIENAEWLELLHRFTGVKNLHITEALGLPVMSACNTRCGWGDTRATKFFLRGVPTIWISPGPC